MKWLLIALLLLASIGALAAFVGSRLPRAHTSSRKATFTVPPAAVWAAITNVDAFTSWRSDVKKIERLPDREGRAVWVEEGRSGRITLAAERSDPPRLLVLAVADPDLPFGGTWTYEIAPAPGGSTLTITENGEIYNPMFRFMARYIFGYEGTISTYMAALEKHLGAASQKG